MKLNLTFVKRTERTSAKTGKPFTSISIKATQYGEKYLSGFGNKDNANWKAGDEVEVAEVVQKGEYLNFEMPKAEKTNGIAPTDFLALFLALVQKFDAVITNQNLIKRDIAKIINHLSGKDRLDLTSAGTPMPTFDQPDELADVPF